MIPLLLSPLGRAGLSVAIVFFAWVTFAKHYEHKGAVRVSAQMEKKVDEHAKTAETVRRSVATVPASGLRDAFTRD